MAKVAYIEVLRERISQTGVKYLIEDDATGDVVRADVLLRVGQDPATYGETNADELYAGGEPVADGGRVLDALKEREKATVHEDALFAAIRALRQGGTLGDMNTAMEAVYTADGTRTGLIVDFVQAYNQATAAERNRFNSILFYALGALVRK